MSATVEGRKASLKNCPKSFKNSCPIYGDNNRMHVWDGQREDLFHKSAFAEINSVQDFKTF